MMSLSKILRYTFCLVLFYFIIPITLGTKVVATSSLGISPSYIKNDWLMPGSSLEQEYVISRSTPDMDAKAIVEVDAPEVESWLSFNPGKEITLPAGEQRVSLFIKVDVPEDAQLGKYTGFVRIKLEDTEANGQVTLLPAVRLDIDLNVSDKEVEAIEIRAAEIQDYSEGGKLPLIVKVKNNGNVSSRITSATLTVSDLNQQDVVIIFFEDFPEVKPFTIEDVNVEIDNSLLAGEYFADIDLLKEEESIFQDKLFFEVFESSNIDATSETEEEKMEQKSDRKSIWFIAVLFTGVILLLIFILRSRGANRKEVVDYGK